MLSYIVYNLQSRAIYIWAFSLFPRIMGVLTGGAANRGAAIDPKLFSLDKR